MSVVLETAPRFYEPNTFTHPGIWISMIEEACRLADEKFLEQHPEAKIIHHDLD